MTASALLQNSMKSKVGHAKQAKPLFTQTASRSFSSGGSTGMGLGKMFGLGVAGASITGLTYISYLGHRQAMKATPQQQL